MSPPFESEPISCINVDCASCKGGYLECYVDSGSTVLDKKACKVMRKREFEVCKKDGSSRCGQVCYKEVLCRTGLGLSECPVTVGNDLYGSWCRGGSFGGVPTAIETVASYQICMGYNSFRIKCLNRVCTGPAPCPCSV